MFQRRLSRQCSSAALTSRGTGLDPAGIPAGRRLRFALGPPVYRGDPNSFLGPTIKRSGPLTPRAGARTKGVPTPTAGIRSSAQQRAGPRSSRPPRRWPTQVCTGAACPEVAQIVSWGSLIRGGSLAMPVGAHTKGGRTPTARIRGPAQKRGGQRSSRPPRRWPTQVFSGAACPKAAQTVSCGRLTKEAALSRRRRAPTRKGRPC